ncbi:hypothetical protein LXL04_013113 [Taraxacum kok-saghyz]
MSASTARVDLDGTVIKPITIRMIGAGGFIGSHMCEKLMSETAHTVFAVDVHDDKLKHLLEPDSLPSAGRIQFYRINIKNDSPAICTPADYITLPLDTIYSNSIDGRPVVSIDLIFTSVIGARHTIIIFLLIVKYCSDSKKRLIHFSTCEIYGKHNW